MKIFNCNKKQNDKDKRTLTVINAYGFIALLILLTVFSSYFIPRAESLKSKEIILKYTNTNDQKWGEFGDFIGGTLNPILSFLALICLIQTLKIQNDALEKQKEELEITKVELRESTKALNLQNKTLEKQNFEGTFFQMLKVHSHLLENVNYNARGGVNEHRGIKSFLHILDVLQDARKTTPLELVYKVAIARHKSDVSLGPYFRNIFVIYHFIDSAEHLSNEERNSYSNIFIAQLSSPELKMIMYYCLSDLGVELKNFIEKYHVLKYLDIGELREIEGNDDYRNKFHENAFK